MSSSNNSAAPSRFYSVRLARWLFRVVWSRRGAWALVCLASLTVLYYQWENRRSAQELAAAHDRMMKRIGTDSVLAFAAPTIPDEQNYFALPVIQQWATEPPGKDSSHKQYNIPEDIFLPQGFVKPRIIENDDGTSRLDLASWAAGRDLKGEPPAVVMHRELGDANGLLPRLVAGLGLPFSCVKPGHREALEATGGFLYEAGIPVTPFANDHMQALGIHLRCAATVGDGTKARETALVMLRLFPESWASYGTLVSALVSLGTHQNAFEALQDALGHAAWNEDSLQALQMQLGRINDLETVERALQAETLVGFSAGIHIREAARRGDNRLFDWNWSLAGQDWSAWLGKALSFCAAYHGPRGWYDANIAFFVDRQLDMLGPEGETAWLQNAQRAAALRRLLDVEHKNIHWNPRHVMAATALPNIGTLHASAAETLFHRRCLIIACALEKHRLRQGVYPPSLDAVRDDLRPFQVADPARPPQLPGYRVEKDGYLLWSAGPDARDDGGTKNKDWLWRMRRANP